MAAVETYRQDNGSGRRSKIKRSATPINALTVAHRNATIASLDFENHPTKAPIANVKRATRINASIYCPFNIVLKM